MATMDERSNATPFDQETFMDKYRDRFMEYVPADAVVSNWEVYHIIDENTRDEVKKALPGDKRSILFRYIRDNGSLDTIRKMCDELIKTGKHGYPHVRSLGEDTREDLKKYLSGSHPSTLKSKPNESEMLDHLGRDISANWEMFAVHLNIDPGVRDQVKEDCRGSSKQCLLQVVKRWLQEEEGTGHLPRTWSSVVSAVEKLDHGDLAARLRDMYIQPSSTTE